MGCGLAAMTAWKNAAVDGPILSPAAISLLIGVVPTPIGTLSY
jgi:hypothetical protein